MKNSKTIFLGVMIALLIMLGQSTFAQGTKPVRKGFTLSGSAGIGVIHFTSGMSSNETSGSLSLPNMKIGAFVNQKLAIYLQTAGQIYEMDGVDRSFDGIIPSVQYYATDKWWVSGGFGAALDTKALYESEQVSANTEWGKGVLLSTGYEFLQREKWALDVQSRLYMASVSREGLDNLEGTNLTVAIGITLF